MEKRIELEKRGRDPAEIKELNLDNCKSTNIVGLTDEFVNLEVLSLINAGLTSLKGFPKLPNLKKLEASDNRISNGLQILSSSPKLTYLNLSGNKIKDLETLQPLKEFKNLKKLDLYNNEATSIENYRQKVFGLISSLQYLDGYDIHDREDEDSEPEDDEVNGNDDDSDEEVSSDTTDDGMGMEDEEDEEEMGLQVVYNDNLEDDSDEGDYEAVEEEEDDELVEEEEEDEEDIQDGADDGENETPAARGKKRKHEDGDGN